MKKIKLSLAVTGLAIVTALIVTSCKKKDTVTTTPDTSTTSTTDNNTAQQNSHDITNIGSQGIENDNGSLSTYRLSQGGGFFSTSSTSVTVNINTVNKNMTVTFNNYLGYDGHLRNGTLYYDWSASAPGVVWYRDSGLVLNITTPNHDYSVNGYTVNINSKQIKNIGRVSGQLTWTDNSNLTILKPSSAGGGTIQWQGNWSIALLNTSTLNNFTAADGTASTTSYPGVFHGYGGSVTNYIDWAHALVSVSSTSFSGTASDGETYTGNISTPLVLNFNCTPMWSKYLYVSGVLNFTPTGKTTRTINYGSGVCDLTYTVTIGAYSITLTI
jgi:hypothetical protein